MLRNTTWYDGANPFVVCFICNVQLQGGVSETMLTGYEPVSCCFLSVGSENKVGSPGGSGDENTSKSNTTSYDGANPFVVCFICNVQLQRVVSETMLTSFG